MAAVAAVATPALGGATITTGVTMEEVEDLLCQSGRSLPLCLPSSLRSAACVRVPWGKSDPYCVSPCTLIFAVHNVVAWNVLWCTMSLDDNCLIVVTGGRDIVLAISVENWSVLY